MFCVLFGLVRFGSFVAQSCCMHVARRSNIHTHVRPYFFFIIVELNLLDTIRFCKTNQLQVLWFLLDAQTQRFFFSLFFHHLSLPTAQLFLPLKICDWIHRFSLLGVYAWCGCAWNINSDHSKKNRRISRRARTHQRSNNVAFLLPNLTVMIILCVHVNF